MSSENFFVDYKAKLMKKCDDAQLQTLIVECLTKDVRVSFEDVVAFIEKQVKEKRWKPDRAVQLLAYAAVYCVEQYKEIFREMEDDQDKLEKDKLRLIQENLTLTGEKSWLAEENLTLQSEKSKWEKEAIELKNKNEILQGQVGASAAIMQQQSINTVHAGAAMQNLEEARSQIAFLTKDNDRLTSQLNDSRGALREAPRRPQREADHRQCNITIQQLEKQLGKQRAVIAAVTGVDPPASYDKECEEVSGELYPPLPPPPPAASVAYVSSDMEKTPLDGSAYIEKPVSVLTRTQVTPKLLRRRFKKEKKRET